MEQLLEQDFSTNDDKIRKHTDSKNAIQKIYQLIAGYHPLVAYDEMTGDLLSACLRPGSSYTSFIEDELFIYFHRDKYGWQSGRTDPFLL